MERFAPFGRPVHRRPMRLVMVPPFWKGWGFSGRFPRAGWRRRRIVVSRKTPGRLVRPASRSAGQASDLDVVHGSRPRTRPMDSEVFAFLAALPSRARLSYAHRSIPFLVHGFASLHLRVSHCRAFGPLRRERFGRVPRRCRWGRSSDGWERERGCRFGEAIQEILGRLGISTERSGRSATFLAPPPLAGSSFTTFVSVSPDFSSESPGLGSNGSARTGVRPFVVAMRRCAPGITPTEPKGMPRAEACGIQDLPKGGRQPGPAGPKGRSPWWFPLLRPTNSFLLRFRRREADVFVKPGISPPTGSRSTLDAL